MVSKQYRRFVTPWGVAVNAVHRADTNDFNTLSSCLQEDEYRIASLPPAIRLDGTILNAIDIGGHIGGCTLALLSRGYKVITVEPLPENMDMIAESVGLNGWDARWRSVHGAISDVRGKPVTVAYGDTTTESGQHHEFIGVTTGIYSENAAKGCRTVEVRGVSIGELVEMCDDRAGWIEAGQKPPFSDGMVEFLKIDCEGAEWEAFGNVSPYTLDKIKVLTAELHPLSTTKDIRAEFTALLFNKFDDISVQVYPYIAAYGKGATTNAYYTRKNVT